MLDSRETASAKSRMALALLRFKASWTELATASKALPEQDMSTMYPFYLLDYEEIAPSVQAWCTYHATELMRGLPDRIPNPACYHCRNKDKPVEADGLCRTPGGKQCIQSKEIIFSRDAVLPLLLSLGREVKGLDDASLHVIYLEAWENEKSS